MSIDRESKKPLYEQIYNILKQDILSGKYEDGELLPSERELCNIFGVERITVRKSLESLSNEGLIVKIAGLGTRVNSHQKSELESSSWNTLLFLLPKSKNSVDRITEPFNSRLLYVVEKEARLKGYNVLYRTVGINDSLFSILSDNSICGIFFVSSIDKKLLTEALESKIPSVALNSICDCFTSIIADNEAGAFSVVDYLIKLGHTKIAAIQGMREYTTSKQRLEGYYKALTGSGIQVDPRLIKEGDWTSNGGYTAMNELLQNKDNIPTAVFAFNDITAFGAIAAINDSGLSVPDDISVVGFDNIDQCEYMRPRLTTVSQDIDLLGKIAVQNLLNLFKEDERFNLKISTPTRLVIRDSAIKNSRSNA